MLGFTVGVLTRCFTYRKSDPYYYNLKSYIAFLCKHPDRLLVKNRDEDGVVQQCAELLALLLGMLTSLPKDNTTENDGAVSENKAVWDGPGLATEVSDIKSSSQSESKATLPSFSAQ